MLLKDYQNRLKSDPALQEQAKAYKAGYDAGYMAAKMEVAKARTLPDRTLLERVYLLAQDIEGLTTEQACAALAMKYDGKHGKSTRAVRDAIKAAGFESAHYYSPLLRENVRAWFKGAVPRRYKITRVPVPQSGPVLPSEYDEDLPL